MNRLISILSRTSLILISLGLYTSCSNDKDQINNRFGSQKGSNATADPDKVTDGTQTTESGAVAPAVGQPAVDPGNSCLSSAKVVSMQTKGVFTFTLNGASDPCDLEGYVFGQRATTAMEYMGNNKYMITSIEPGVHKLYVISKTGQKTGRTISGINSTIKEITTVQDFTLPSVSKIHGSVRFQSGDGAPLAGVVVSIVGLDRSATTDANGDYSFADVPVGEYSFTFTKPSYREGYLDRFIVFENNDQFIVPMTLFTDTPGTPFISVNGGALGITQPQDGITATFDGFPSSAKYVSVSTPTQMEGFKTIWNNIKILPSGPITVNVLDDKDYLLMSITKTLVNESTVYPTFVKPEDFNPGPAGASLSFYRATDTGLPTIDKIVLAKSRDMSNPEYIPLSREALAGRDRYTFTVPKFDKSMFYAIENTFGLRSNPRNTWPSYTPKLSSARSGMSMIALHKKVYFAAGHQVIEGKVRNTSVVDVFNTESDSWEANFNLSKKRRNIQVASTATEILFGPGDESNSVAPLKTVDIYDTATQSIRTESLSIARFGAIALSTPDAVYFMGGYRIERDANGTASFVSSSVIDIYDPKLKTWSASSMPSPRDSFAMVYVDKKIYLIGGNSSGQRTLTVDVYDTVAHTWATNTDELFLARVQPKASVYKGKIYVFGGFTGPDETPSKVEIYDLSTLNWSVKPIFDTQNNLSDSCLYDGKFVSFFPSKAALNAPIHEVSLETATLSSPKGITPLIRRDYMPMAQGNGFCAFAGGTQTGLTATTPPSDEVQFLGLSR